MAPRNRRRSRTRPPGVRGALSRNGNKRFLDAWVRLHARQAASLIRPASRPLDWPWIAGGVALLVVNIITTITFFSVFASATLEHGLWRSAPVWFFGLGLVVWLAGFWAGLRPLKIYIYAHELTHAAFVILCGGKVHGFQVRDDGGHVLTDKNNLLISLSPYFVPLITLVIALIYGLCGWIWDLDQTYAGFFFNVADFRWDWLLFFSIGLTWGFHFTFTVWMLTRDQPDLEYKGAFFSLIFIYFVNLALISSLLVAASPALTLAEFGHTWWDLVESAARWCTAR